jgi:hypothetical protein
MRVMTHIYSLIVFISLSFECLASSGSKEISGSRVLGIIVGLVVLVGIALSIISQVNQKGGGYASARDYSNQQQRRSDGHAFLILLVVGVIFLIAKACG